MAEIIGTSSQAVEAYMQSASDIFNRIRDRMQVMVGRAFALTYEGPDAELEFNPGLIRLATTTVGQMDDAMVDFAIAVSQVTSNIAQALGGQPVTLTYHPRPLELPPPPGVQADDYRIDVTAFDTFISGELPELRSAVGVLIDENERAFAAIPRATAEQRGWSGQARDHAEHVVVPQQSEALRTMLATVVDQLSGFMTTARDAAVGADQAGLAR